MNMIANNPGSRSSARRSAVASTLALPDTRDMPIVRTTGNLDLWRKLHRVNTPRASAKSGSELLADIRAERDARCS
ncbi:MAG: hypothetical protein IPN53_00765 [Comamonadaceae bacterium]|nr:hypothetical protein [Comamonadaceae bacterium]